jgi:hypothetical protein
MHINVSEKFAASGVCPEDRGWGFLFNVATYELKHMA